MKDLLKRPVAFHPILARLFGGINEAIYWQQLHYWSDKGGRPDGFIYKTKEEIEEETTLTRDQQDRVRKKLEEAGYIETKLIKANGHPTVHYKVNFPLVENQLMEKRVSHYSEKRVSRECITESTQRVTPSEAKASPVYEVVPDLPLKEKKSTTPSTTVFNIFKEVLGKHPLNWNNNRTIRQAAENLLEERGEDGIRKALNFFKEHKEEEFCPTIITPWDLDSKWDKLLTFKKKYGN
jgi:hypothetical protein